MCLAPPLASHHTVLTSAIWVAAALTVITGGQYYVDGRRAAQARSLSVATTGAEA
jgi:hypothetical protein